MEEERTGFFAWLQDNARILLSVALVLFLLFAVYSYSKRTDRTTAVVSDSETDELVLLDDTELPEGEFDEEDALTTDLKQMLDSTDKIVSGETDAPTTTTDAEIAKEEPTMIIEHKDGSIVVAAERGDGLTHLARKAAADFIAANKLQDISPEQKVYIEDYLQKSIGRQSVHTGTTVSFSNDLIATSIEKANALTPAQIANLAKYVR